MLSLTDVSIPRAFIDKKRLMEGLGTLVQTLFDKTRNENRRQELADSFAKGASSEVLAELSRPFLKQKISCELCAKLPELDALVQKLQPNQKVLNNFLNTPVSDLGLSVRLRTTLAREANGFVREILYKKTGEGSSFENLKGLPQQQINALINVLLATLQRFHLESILN